MDYLTRLAKGPYDHNISTPIGGVCPLIQLLTVHIHLHTKSTYSMHKIMQDRKQEFLLIT